MNPFITEEGVHPLWLLQSISGQNGNRMEVDAALAQCADTAHGLGVRTLAVPEASVAVVNVFRPVDTHTNYNEVTHKAVSPVFVDQRCVGLQVLFDHHPLLLQARGLALDDRAGLVIEAGR